MSEGTRRPDGSSGPATTDDKPSGGDDIYAAAAARAANRTAKPAQGARSAGDNGTSPTSPPARSQQAAAQSGSGPASAGATSGAGDKSGGPAAALGNMAGQVINAVRPSRAKADPAADGDGAAKRSTEPASANASPAAAPAAPAAEPKAQPVDDKTREVPPLVGPGARESKPTEADADHTQVQPAVKDENVAKAESKQAEPKKAEKAEKAKVGAARGTRKARLRLSRLDPWSVMKTAFMFSIAAGIVLVVAVYAVWLVIGSSGLFASIDSIVGSVLQSPGDTTPFRIEDYVNTQKVMGVTAFLACIDVVIFTALATLASFLYNLAATMLGGLEVTLAED